MTHKHDFKRYPELTNNQMNKFYFQSPHKQITQDFQAKIVKVHDGDTVLLQWSERDFHFPLRFLNIAAPELNEKGGLKSRNWLKNLILNQKVDIIINPNNRVEKWGRLLGTIQFQGLDVGQESIINGFAVPYPPTNMGTIPKLEAILS